MLNPKLLNVIDCKCNLGEGLYTNSRSVCWVDINDQKIFLYENNKLFEFLINLIPSIIYEITSTEIILGSNLGLISINKKTKEEKFLLDPIDQHDTQYYRSNDGGVLQNHKYLSFMHIKKPNDFCGYVYRISNKKYILEESNIFIPNSFIPLTENEILISDSFCGEIWKYQLNRYGSLTNKKLWFKFNSNEKIAPDGGCRIGKYIYICLWDDSSIGVFSIDGNLLTKIELPVLRPTNCKFNPNKSELWITSAREGLDTKSLNNYPESGNTLIYALN